jgi:hypothetical protein
VAVAAPAAMLVPEASVDKNNLLSTIEDEVGLARQSRLMQPEAVSQRVGQATNYQFWPGVL